jgi:tripartite ATP-independent transporter DctM subunit
MKELFRAFKFAFFPLMTPVILLAGIYSGAFTPTEAAVVCTLYAIIVAFAMNRDMKLKHLVPIGRNVLLQTGVTMFVIAAINVFRWIIVREHIPEIIANLVVQMNISKPLMLALLNIVLLGLGCLLPITTIMLAFVPILLPILPLLNIDLVHFGGVLTINLMIGLVTPPFGMQLFVIHGLTKIPISQIIQKVWPQLASVGIVLILITYYEPLVLWLPNLMKQVLVFLTFPEYTPN